MQTQVELEFQDMAASPAVEQQVADHVKKLEQLYGRITACRIVVKAPGQRHQTGGPYDIRIRLALPDGSQLQVFGEGGGQQVADRLSRTVGADVPLLGQLPLDPALVAAGDAGVPIVLSAPDSPVGKELRNVADGSDKSTVNTTWNDVIVAGSTPAQRFDLLKRLEIFSTAALESPRICAAKMPALVAPGLPIATVATGMPAGI